VDVVQTDGQEKSDDRKESSSKVEANVLPIVDSRMAGILHNLQNSGNITINFNFDRK
jgi:hypothetical protein